MKTYEYIEESKRPVAIFNYKTQEPLGEYESVTAAAKAMFNNPQKSVLLYNILANRCKSVKCEKFNTRISVKYLS
ncbi:MAG: hypothetical protein E6R13_06325 [Spirochaetes bacterium]|nr:MAG: hypothetical protein E6R13_06325 [Spirochaetota bacterium]